MTPDVGGETVITVHDQFVGTVVPVDGHRWSQDLLPASVELCIDERIRIRSIMVHWLKLRTQALQVILGRGRRLVNIDVGAGTVDFERCLSMRPAIQVGVLVRFRMRAAGDIAVVVPVPHSSAGGEQLVGGARRRIADRGCRYRVHGYRSRSNSRSAGRCHRVAHGYCSGVTPVTGKASSGNRGRSCSRCYRPNTTRRHITVCRASGRP